MRIMLICLALFVFAACDDTVVQMDADVADAALADAEVTDAEVMDAEVMDSSL